MLKMVSFVLGLFRRYVLSNTESDLAVIDVGAERDFRVAGADLGRHLRVSTPSLRGAYVLWITMDKSKMTAAALFPAPLVVTCNKYRLSRVGNALHAEGASPLRARIFP